MKNPFSAGLSGINALRTLTVLAALALVAQPVFSAIADGGRTAAGAKQGVVTAEMADRIVFAPDGSVVGGGAITLTDVDGHSRRITVTPDGEIQID